MCKCATEGCENEPLEDSDLCEDCSNSPKCKGGCGKVVIEKGDICPDCIEEEQIERETWDTGD